MHVRTGDTVQVIAGKDKGKIGEVTKVHADSHLLVVKLSICRTAHCALLVDPELPYLS